MRVNTKNEPEKQIKISEIGQLSPESDSNRSRSNQNECLTEATTIDETKRQIKKLQTAGDDRCRNEFYQELWTLPTPVHEEGKYLADHLDQYFNKIQYKILTSILAERLKVVPDIMNKDQCGFVINR